MRPLLKYIVPLCCHACTLTQDLPRRRSNSQKAWTGANPITQRYSQQNGNMSFQKQSTSPKPSKESNTSDNHAHDRLLFLVTSFIVRCSRPIFGVFFCLASRVKLTICARVWLRLSQPRMEKSSQEYFHHPPLKQANRLLCWRWFVQTNQNRMVQTTPLLLSLG